MEWGDEKLCREWSVTPVPCRSRYSQPELLGTSAAEAAEADQTPFPKLGSRMRTLLSQPSLQLSSINSSLLDTLEQSDLLKPLKGQ